MTVSRGDSERELGELTQRFVDTVPLGHHRTHLVAAIVLAVLAGVCVLATLVRLSPLPLIPLPALAVATYAHCRARRAHDDRQLLVWTGIMIAGVLVAFWLIAVVGRMFD